MEKMDFKAEIEKLEEAAHSITEKSTNVTDLDLMSAIQHVQQCIHGAYVALMRITK